MQPHEPEDALPNMSAMDAGLGDGLRGPGDGETEPHFEGYRVVSKLGAGGMGVVWKAIQLGTEQAVAIKTLGLGPSASRKARQRFEREVRLAAGLKHPNIARVYDSPLHHGRYGYVMELIHGIPLDQYVAKHQLTYGQSMALLIQVCRAVQYAHERGVVHRDLKPSNVLVTEDGQTKLLDFGLARVKDERDLSVTKPGEVVGTPNYMSPEQVDGRLGEVDEGSDIYALGVMMYQVITGRVPYEGSLTSVVSQIGKGEFLPPRQINRSVPGDLETICLKAMSRYRDHRYATAKALAEDLERFCNHEPIRARQVSSGTVIKTWVCHPDRTRQMGTLLLTMGSVLALVHLMAVGALGFKYFNSQALNNGVPVGRPLAWVCFWTVFFLVGSLLSVGMRRHRVLAIWSLVIYNGGLLVFAVGTLTGFFPYEAGGTFDDETGRLGIFLFFTIIAMLGFGASVVGTISYYVGGHSVSLSLYDRPTADAETETVPRESD